MGEPSRSPLTEPTPSWVDSSESTTSCAKVSEGIRHVGVVFVHGVGFQHPGDTLLSWSAALIRALRDDNLRQTGVVGADPVLRSVVDLTGTTRPVVEIAVSADEHWVFTEAYWASSIRPPTFGEVLRWLLIEGGIERAVDHLQRLPGPRIEKSTPVKRLFVSLVGAIALLAYGAVRGIAGLIPGSRPGVIGSVDGFLTAWSGDMRVLLFDEVQSLVILNRVAAAVRSLEGYGCHKLTLLAHSGGAVASYMSLVKYPSLAVTDLVTFGEGLNIAWRLAERHREASGGRAALLAGAISLADRPVRWSDYWATEDPVPNWGLRPPQAVAGPAPSSTPGFTTRTATDIPTTELGTPISNSWSMGLDHGGYWENDEEFVLPVLSRLAVGPGDVEQLANDDVRRRLQRLSLIAGWRHLSFISGLFAIILATLGVSYHMFVAPHVQEAGLVHGVVLWIERGLTYAVDPTPVEEIRVNPFRGGPIYALGEVVRDLWNAIPGTGILGAPVDALRRQADHPLVALATSVGLILGPFMLLMGSLNALPNTKRWLRAWTGGTFAGPATVGLWTLAAIVCVTAFLAYVGLLFIGLGVGANQNPYTPMALAAIVATVVIFGLLRLLGLIDAIKLAADVAQWWLALAMLATLPLAMLINPGYGIYVLGSLVAFGLFQVVSGVGSWRWRSWDIQERWEVRTGRQRRHGRRWDYAEAAMLVLGLVAFALGFGLLDLVPAWSAIAFALGALVFITVALTGVRRDFANTPG